MTAITVVAAGLSLWPQAALASSPAALWVSSAPTVTGHGRDCAHPGYNAIQAAITKAPRGAVIDVCHGTYIEQLRINKSVSIRGIGSVTVELPGAAADSTTKCDTAPGTGSYQPDQDGVVICGRVHVAITHLTVDAAWPTSTCDDSLYGVLIGGGAIVHFTDSAVTAGGAVPLNGCQGGIGIQDGMGWTTPNEVGHLFLTDSRISGYQKNGITVDGKGSTARIAFDKVTGIGPTASIAQNGIQVSNGALAVITHSVISGNECDVAVVCGPHALTENENATGILFYAAARGSTVENSVIKGNDIGVYYEANPAGKEPGSPQVFITRDTLSKDRYAGVQLDQGRASVAHCTISGGRIGIQVIQYGGAGGQTFGPRSVASFDKVTGTPVATVEVLSDRMGTDKPGSFTISRSNIDSGPIRDNSTNLPIIRRHDS
jgi:hypothetical protein